MGSRFVAKHMAVAAGNTVDASTGFPCRNLL